VLYKVTTEADKICYPLLINAAPDNNLYPTLCGIELLRSFIPILPKDTGENPP
jgi:hypothetical protein